LGPCNLIKKVTVLETQVQVQFMTLFHTCCETLHRSWGWRENEGEWEEDSSGGGLIGQCVPLSPQPWREIDAHDGSIGCKELSHSYTRTYECHRSRSRIWWGQNI